MMIKKSVYPKTERIKDNHKVVITEKLDGSNLVFFKLNEELHIAQRNNIYKLSDIDSVKDIMYRGLYVWLEEHGKELESSMYELSAICGEWIGMGHIKYGEHLDKKYYMFAKSNINEETMELKKILYRQDLFIYPFINQEIPSFMGIVPITHELDYMPKISDLDKMFTDYESYIGRLVEGFIVLNGESGTIKKYVRRKGKGGVLQDHLH